MKSVISIQSFFLDFLLSSFSSFSSSSFDLGIFSFHLFYFVFGFDATFLARFSTLASWPFRQLRGDSDSPPVISVVVVAVYCCCSS